MLPDNWRVILLKARSKEPLPRNGGHWVARNLTEVQRHLSEGGNIGIFAGPLIVLDFDKAGAFAEMCAALGPLQQWVRTGSGKAHCYTAPALGLPAKLRWQGEVVGEIQRGATQYVVAPPSVHPCGGRYEWLVDPLATLLPELPEAWLSYLVETETPSYIAQDRRGHPEEEAWSGPPPEAILRAALSQPGARSRGGGVKFRCPQCAADGHDRHMDNAKVFSDGRWGCAYDQTHGRAIGVALGVLIAAVEEQRDWPLADVAPEPDDIPLSDEPKEGTP